MAAYVLPPALGKPSQLRNEFAVVREGSRDSPSVGHFAKWSFCISNDLAVGDSLAHACPNTVLRIQQSREGDTVVLTLSGRIDTEHVGELQRIVENHRGTHLILDLTDVSLVDREAITMLAAFEDAGAELREGPAYVLEWIRNEHSKPSGGFES